MRSAADKKATCEELVMRELGDYGILPFLRGFDYILTACLMALNASNPVIDFCRIYPRVAAHYYTTPQRVDRAIRHALEISWHNGKSIRNIYPDAIPSNSTFVSFLCEQVLNYYRQA